MGTQAPQTSSDVRTFRVRLAMPDMWLECIQQLPNSATVREAKLRGLEAMLMRPVGEGADYYVDFMEQRVRDEGITLQELGVRPDSALFIRAYDLGHYPSFRG